MMISEVTVNEGTVAIAFAGVLAVGAYFYVTLMGQVLIEAFGPEPVAQPQRVVIGGALAQARLRRLNEWVEKNEFDLQVTGWTEHAAHDRPEARWIEAEFDTDVITAIPAEDFWNESDEHRRWKAAA